MKFGWKERLCYLSTYLHYVVFLPLLQKFSRFLHSLNCIFKQSINQSTSICKAPLKQTFSERASYELACTNSQFLRFELNCSGLILVFLGRDGSVFQFYTPIRNASMERETLATPVIFSPRPISGVIIPDSQLPKCTKILVHIDPSRCTLASTYITTT